MSQLAHQLRNFYERKGNKVLFSNGMTLNQLALKMWEQLGLKEVDASVLSRVLSGERLFTSRQLEVFCKVSKLSRTYKRALEEALARDVLTRSGLDFKRGRVERALDSYEENVLKFGARELLNAATQLPVPKQLGEYVGIEGPQSGKSEAKSCIGIILPKFYPKYEEVVLSILQKELERRGFGWNVTYSAESPLLFARQFWLFYKKLGLSGVIALPPSSGVWSKILDGSTESDYPLVCIDRSLTGGSKFVSVKPTHLEGSSELVRKLLRGGYKKVILVEGDGQIEAYKKRAQGFEAGIEGLGISSRRVLIREGKLGLWKSVPEKKRLERFIRRQSPKEGLAFFAVNSVRAKLIYHATLLVFGEWPKNWAMAHFDGLDESGLKDGQFYGAEQQKEDIAEEAVKLLMRKIKKLPIRNSVEQVPTQIVNA